MWWFSGKFRTRSNAHIFRTGWFKSDALPRLTGNVPRVELHKRRSQSFVTVAQTMEVEVFFVFK